VLAICSQNSGKLSARLRIKTKTEFLRSQPPRLDGSTYVGDGLNYRMGVTSYPICAGSDRRRAQTMLGSPWDWAYDGHSGDRTTACLDAAVMSNMNFIHTGSA
jgi:hypothetical protein